MQKINETKSKSIPYKESRLKRKHMVIIFSREILRMKKTEIDLGLKIFENF
jgi:hypothetical protein